MHGRSTANVAAVCADIKTGSEPAGRIRESTVPGMPPEDVKSARTGSCPKRRGELPVFCFEFFERDVPAVTGVDIEDPKAGLLAPGDPDVYLWNLLEP